MDSEYLRAAAGSYLGGIGPKLTLMRCAANVPVAERSALIVLLSRRDAKLSKPDPVSASRGTCQNKRPLNPSRCSARRP